LDPENAMPRRHDDDEEDRDDDRPRKRRSEDDEDDLEDDRSRKKRRDDDDDLDDDDDRPRKRRRSRDDDDYDDYDVDDARRQRKRKTLDRATLRSIALFQKGILVAILVYLAVFVAQFFIPPQLRWILGLGLALPTMLVAVVFVFLLATKVYSPVTGVLLALLTFIPCIGLIVLLIINSKATAVLQLNGISVGFLGASLSDID
jgi:hypothetical protein